MRVGQIVSLKKNPSELAKILRITDEDKAWVEFCNGGTKVVIELFELEGTDRREAEKTPFNGAVCVLGTVYSVTIVPENDPTVEGMDGFCDTSMKRIIVRDVKQSIESLGDLAYYQRKVLRHEIIHAFLYESGLDVNACKLETGWARNEEMVDWYAIQSPKIHKAFREVGCEEE